MTVEDVEVCLWDHEEDGSRHTCENTDDYKSVTLLCVWPGEEKTTKGGEKKDFGSRTTEAQNRGPTGTQP